MKSKIEPNKSISTEPKSQLCLMNSLGSFALPNICDGDLDERKNHKCLPMGWLPILRQKHKLKNSVNRYSKWNCVFNRHLSAPIRPQYHIKQRSGTKFAVVVGDKVF